MPDTRASLHTRRLKPGMLVAHRIHGIGSVVGEWGPIAIDLGLPACLLGLQRDLRLRIR
jgi:hypothetical protein